MTLYVLVVVTLRQRGRGGRNDSKGALVSRWSVRGPGVEEARMKAPAQSEETRLGLGYVLYNVLQRFVCMCNDEPGRLQLEASRVH